MLILKPEIINLHCQHSVQAHSVRFALVKFLGLWHAKILKFSKSFNIIYKNMLHVVRLYISTFVLVNLN